MPCAINHSHPAATDFFQNTIAPQLPITIWNVDSAGNYTTSAVGLVTGSSSAVQLLEAGFNQDLNHDGLVSSLALAYDGWHL